MRRRRPRRRPGRRPVAYRERRRSARPRREPPRVPRPRREDRREDRRTEHPPAARRRPPPPTARHRPPPTSSSPGPRRAEAPFLWSPPSAASTRLMPGRPACSPTCSTTVWRDSWSVTPKAASVPNPNHPTPTALRTPSRMSAASWPRGSFSVRPRRS